MQLIGYNQIEMLIKAKSGDTSRQPNVLIKKIVYFPNTEGISEYFYPCGAFRC